MCDNIFCLQNILFGHCNYTSPTAPIKIKKIKRKKRKKNRLSKAQQQLYLDIKVSKLNMTCGKLISCIECTCCACPEKSKYI